MFSLHKKYSRGFLKLRLMLHGLFYQSPCYISGHGNISVVLLSMEGLRALRFKQKYLNLKMNGGLTGLERHQGE